MTDQTHILAERAVPRYTSYPTAPHFSPAVGPHQYASWLESLSDQALSLYVHVPFCTNLCHYCGCHTKAVRQREPVEAYADRLRDEIALVRAAVAGRPVERLHWGGGTPSLLGDRQLIQLTDALRDAFDFGPIEEHAIELDPRTVTQPLAATLRAIGVNRASLGVQDFSPQVQQAIGRVQPSAIVEQAVTLLRDAGIAEINFDLMYGLPLQTVDDVRRSAELTVSMRPQRIALFGYAHVPWFKVHQRLIDDTALPDAADRLTQARVAQDSLVALGYVPIGLDHFARPDDPLVTAVQSGDLRRNFQGYTNDQAGALIGFGASAIGRLPQGYAQNQPDIAGYSRAVQAGRFATARGIALSADDRRRGRIIEQLMCDFAVDLDDDGEAFASERAALLPLAAQGLVQVEGNRITVTEQGRPFVRLVAATFDTYLAGAKARHSVAV